MVLNAFWEGRKRWPWNFLRPFKLLIKGLILHLISALLLFLVSLVIPARTRLGYLSASNQSLETPVDVGKITADIARTGSKRFIFLFFYPTDRSCGSRARKCVRETRPERRNDNAAAPTRYWTDVLRPAKPSNRVNQRFERNNYFFRLVISIALSRRNNRLTVFE